MSLSKKSSFQLSERQSELFELVCNHKKIGVPVRKTDLEKYKDELSFLINQGHLQETQAWIGSAKFAAIVPATYSYLIWYDGGFEVLQSDAVTYEFIVFNRLTLRYRVEMIQAKAKSYALEKLATKLDEPSPNPYYWNIHFLIDHNRQGNDRHYTLESSGVG